MAKTDFWFKFFPDKWTGGTSLMNYEERGFYITLLMVQFQSGHIPMKTIRFLLGSHSVTLWDAISSKFVEDENGNFYNEFMEELISIRSNVLKVKKENGEKGGRPKKEKTETKPNGYELGNLKDNLNNNLKETYSNSNSIYNSISDSSNSVSSISINRGMQGGLEIATERPSHEWYESAYLRFVGNYGQTGRSNKPDAIRKAICDAVNECKDKHTPQLSYDEILSGICRRASECRDVETQTNSKRQNPENWLNNRCYELPTVQVPTEKTKQQAKQDEIMALQEKVAREFFDKQKQQEAKQ